METERKLGLARVKLVMRYPFFGTMALGLETIRRDDVSTMATNGYKIFYNKDFVDKLSLEEVAGVYAHEIGHVVFLHLNRRQSREPDRWNRACDYAVNDLVLEAIELENHQNASRNVKATNIALPDGKLYDPAYHGKAAEYIYGQLPPDPPGGGGSGSGTLDNHDIWSEVDQGKVQDENGNTVTRADLENKIREAVAQAATQARLQGKLPSGIEQLVEGILEPKLDWKAILREMVTSSILDNFRLIPPNRKHLWRGIYLPSTIGESLEIGLAVDTSGSVGDKELLEFISEVVSICEAFENYTIHLFYCDAKVHAYHELHPGDNVPRKVIGRGGTSFEPPFEYVREHNLDIRTMLYFTDAYGSFPPEPTGYPTIWVVTTDQKVPWGERIQYPTD